MATLRQLRILPPTLRSSSPNLTRLLRAPRTRPTGGTAEQRDKLAPLQLPKLHPLPLAREQNSGSATISQGSLQCGIAVRPMSPRGQKPKLPRCNIRGCFSSNSGHYARTRSSVSVQGSTFHLYAEFNAAWPYP